MRFTNIAPYDVDVHVVVPRGESIDVPDVAAGRPYSEELDDDGNIVSRDLGEGLLAQPGTWLVVPEDLDELTIPQLTGYASARGVDLGKWKKKADIIAALVAATKEA